MSSIDGNRSGIQCPLYVSSSSAGRAVAVRVAVWNIAVVVKCPSGIGHCQSRQARLRSTPRRDLATSDVEATISRFVAAACISGDQCARNIVSSALRHPCGRSRGCCHEGGDVQCYHWEKIPLVRARPRRPRPRSAQTSMIAAMARVHRLWSLFHKRQRMDERGGAAILS